MSKAQEILMQSKSPLGWNGMEVLYDKEQRIPGSTQYHIRRYYAQDSWAAEDTGMLIYHFNEATPKENYLELRFCISGNRYCENKTC